MPKISIIIAITSNEKNISPCIESLTSQTFDDFECLLIKQNKEEESSFLDTLVCKDARFKFIKTPLENPSKWDCYNAALYQVKGTSIMFLNDTDVLHHQALDIFSDALKYSHAHVAASTLAYFSTGNVLKRQKKVIPFDKSMLKTKYQHILPDFWQGNSLYITPALEGKMFSSEIISYLKFHSNLADFAPYFFMEQFYSLAKSTTQIKYPLYFLRKEAHIPSIASFATLLSLKERVIFEYAYFIEAGRTNGYTSNILKRKCSQDIFNAIKHVILHTPESTLICINQQLINIVLELKEYDLLQGLSLSFIQKITLWTLCKNKMPITHKLLRVFG